MAFQYMDKEHPEFIAAVEDAIRHTVETRPQDPKRNVAEHVLAAVERIYEETGDVNPRTRQAEGNQTTSSVGAGGGGGGHNNDEKEEEDENSTNNIRARAAAGRGRRGVVFSESLKLDAGWTPIVVPKTDAEMAEILAVISRNILLSGIDADGKTLLVKAMAKKTFDVGEVIIRQGDMGDFFYIIAEGTADISVNGKVVLQVGKGSGFGELALLYDAPRAATVTATSSSSSSSSSPTSTPGGSNNNKNSSNGVVAWAIDRDTFKRVIIGATQRKRELYASFLREVPIFSTLRHEEIATMSDALQPTTYRVGDVIVRQGDTETDRFYIVEEGECKAEMTGIEGEVCDRMRRGTYFGERSLLTDAPRAATVTAVGNEPTRLLAMDRASFVRLMGPLTELLQRNMEVYEKFLHE